MGDEREARLCEALRETREELEETQARLDLLLEIARTGVVGDRLEVELVWTDDRLAPSHRVYVDGVLLGLFRVYGNRPTIDLRPALPKLA